MSMFDGSCLMYTIQDTGPTTDLHRVSAVISKVVSTYRQWTRGMEEISEGIGAATNRLSSLDQREFSRFSGMI